MRPSHFPRLTVAAALDLLKDRLTNTQFDLFAFGLGLNNVIDPSLTLPKKVVQLGMNVHVAADRTVQTLDGPVPLSEAIVRRAVDCAHAVQADDVTQARLMRALALDGFVVEFDDSGGSPRMRAALPAAVQMTETDDEVHQLLKHFAFATSQGHLDQAIDAHTRGDWAASNGQTRTFIESLFDDIARYCDPANASSTPSSDGRRAMLGNSGFLSVARNEWNGDGKGYLNGLFRMLHSDGSHPGLSDEDHSTFRLHVALTTARLVLRRLRNQR